MSEISRRWVYTLMTSQTTEPKEHWNPDLMAYLKVQVEKAPTTGQLHYQGCLIMKKATRMTGVKKALNAPTAHLEPAKAWDRAVAYCGKEETRVDGPWEYGKPTTQGQRKDIELLAEAVKLGKRDRELADEYPVSYMRYYKGVQALRSAQTPKTNRTNMRAAVFWGETGSGKTWSATEAWGDNYYTVFQPTHPNPWFDGYQGEANVLFDDVGVGLLDCNFLKRLLDIYPVLVPVKGGSVAWLAETIVLTSNLHMDRWYPSATTEDMNALRRRVKQFHFPTQRLEAQRWLRGEPEARPTTWIGGQQPTTVVDTDDDVVDLDRSDELLWAHD